MGVGIAGAAFWVFVAAVAIAGIWREVVFRRESETTLRLAIEKGQTLDPAVVEKLLKPRSKRGPEGLLVAGGLNVAAGIGLPVLGYLLEASGNGRAFYPLLGVGILTFLIGVAFILLSGLLRTRRGNGESGSVGH